MLFNSLQFYIFFPIVVTGYFLLPQRCRWFWLLLASCYFYMAFIPVYILILGATIVVDFFAALWIQSTHGNSRKLLLFLSILSNVGFLAFFKYYNFVADNVMALSYALDWNLGLPLLRVALPIGLSFHTFQAMSYVIEVYRGKQKAEQHFGIYALYVMFFPQLVAGPIERPQNLLHQFYEYHPFEEGRVIAGLQLMARGFFKKVVIADNAALAVNTVFNHVYLYHGVPLIIAAIFFSIQLFCDFSGYSDIARGAAQVMGFRLMLNFNKPYMADSLADFWRRWHISLSTWFRDYLFQPLAYIRSIPARLRLEFALVVTFSISGLWHGANWTYILWGFSHGFLMAFSLATKRLRARVNALTHLENFPRILRSLRVGLVMVMWTLLLIFFRSNTIHDAWYVFRELGSGSLQQLFHPQLLRADSPGIYFGGLSIVLASIIAYWIFSKITPRWWTWYAFLLWLLYFGAFSKQTFIYFQF